MAERLVNNLKEDYLSCSICLQQYRHPKALSCNHVFCKECILQYLSSNIVRDKDQFSTTCPLCRIKIPIKRTSSRSQLDLNSWVEGLPADALIDSLIETIQRHEIKSKNTPRCLPKLCDTHGGKSKDAYCFTHTKRICWECAARDHRSCNVDSTEKARHMVQPEVASLKTIVSKNLSTARDLCENDHKFNESKETTVKAIQDFENRLDDMYTSAKHQIKLLNMEIVEISKKHLDERKIFYEVVSSLLELNNKLEAMEMNEDTGEILNELESVTRKVTRYKKQMETITAKSEMCGEDYMTFIVNEQMQTFLTMFSGVGFIDSNLDEVSILGASNGGPKTVPLSLAHILR